RIGRPRGHSSCRQQEQEGRANASAAGRFAAAAFGRQEAKIYRCRRGAPSNAGRSSPGRGGRAEQAQEGEGRADTDQGVAFQPQGKGIGFYFKYQLLWIRTSGIAREILRPNLPPVSSP